MKCCPPGCCSPKAKGIGGGAVVAAVLVAAAAKPLLHAVVVVAQVAAVVAAVLVVAAVAIGVWRLVDWSRRRQALKREAIRAYLAKRQALPAPPLAIEAPRLAPAWDNGASMMGGTRVAVQERAGADDDVDGVHGVQVRGAAPGVGRARQGVPWQVPVPPGRH